jgi:hypothetical protein
VTEYTTFLGERITVGCIVEATVRIRSQHMGWGIVEALYPADCLGVASARVRDLSGKVEDIDLPFLKLHHKYRRKA